MAATPRALAQRLVWSVLPAALFASSILACGDAGDPAESDNTPRGPRPYFSFFVTSQNGLTSLPAGRFSPAPDPVDGFGGDLGGLEGADRHCQALAQAAGSTGKTWRAYLSTQAAGGAAAVNARDRIGAGLLAPDAGRDAVFAVHRQLGGEAEIARGPEVPDVVVGLPDLAHERLGLDLRRLGERGDAHRLFGERLVGLVDGLETVPDVGELAALTVP